MAKDSLKTLLRKVQDECDHHRYSSALKMVRDAKIIDLNNIFLSAIEQYLAAVPLSSSAETTEKPSKEKDQIISLLINRAVKDRDRRSSGKRSENLPTPSDTTLLLEKIKNQYFQRADLFIEAKEFGRALEEVQRIYFFDPLNIVAKEYVLKIGQLVDLQKK